MQRLYIALFFLISLSSCKTLYLREVKSNADFIEKNNTLHELYIISDNRAFIKSHLLYKAVFNGQIDGDIDRDFYFTIESIDFFSDWSNGWTEGRIEAFGKIFFQREGASYKVNVVEPISLWEIKKGAIRYYNDYYIDIDGLTKVDNRVKRIMEVTPIIKDKLSQDYFIGLDYKRKGSESFRYSIRTLLFPETLFLADNEEFKRTARGGVKTPAFGYFWNHDYTKFIFPDELEGLRNSGTIWRDFEEAPGLFLFFYNFEYYFYSLDGAVFNVLKEVKK